MGIFDLFRKKCQQGTLDSRSKENVTLQEQLSKKQTDRAQTHCVNESHEKEPPRISETVPMSKVISLVKEIVRLEHSNDQNLLKNKLKTFESYLSASNGNDLIKNYVGKEDLCLCFSFLMYYIGGTESQNILWAEKAFYCIVEHLDNQQQGRQGQAEACLLFFVMLCVGRNYLKPRLQKIIDSSVVMNAKTHKSLFDAVDTVKGAQNVIDQFSLMAISGIRDLGPAAIQPMMAITNRYNGTEFFEQIIKRTDLMRYDPMDVIDKMRFLKNEIAQSLL